jgi:hypothetical protein
MLAIPFSVFVAALIVAALIGAASVAGVFIARDARLTPADKRALQRHRAAMRHARYRAREAAFAQRAFLRSLRA